MITPFFTIDQDEEYIYIKVKISHIRFSAQGIEMVVQGELFVFALSPYYLRIRLPFACVDDERSHAEYDSKNECVNIKIPKEIKGQFFPDLDLTSKLLARQNESSQAAKNPSTKPLIEELDVANVVDGKDNTTVIEEEGTQFNWEIEQNTSGQDSEIKVTTNEFNYGFDNIYNGLIGVSLANGNDINELGDPEHTLPEQRIVERLIKENIKFDADYYATDYLMEKYPTPDDEKNIPLVLQWKNPYTKAVMKWFKENSANTIPQVEFTKSEQEKMLDLPRKSYLVDSKQLLITLISLLFAYNFDLRETEGEHNVESAWTVGKICPQIAMLDSQLVSNAQPDINILRSAIITCTRRSLCYPFHRNFNLSKKVWQDVYYNLRGGKRMVIRALLDLRELFRYHDVYYVYNKIWMDDITSWVISDSVSENMIRSLAHDLKREYDSMGRQDIVFEKAEEKEELEEPNEENMDLNLEEDDLVAISLDELDFMAEESYKQYNEQKPDI